MKDELLPFPAKICDLTLGEKPSDGETTCGGCSDLKCIPEGHPIYWQSPHHEYGDCDGYCLPCAIDHAESLFFMAGCAKKENTRPTQAEPSTITADQIITHLRSAAAAVADDDPSRAADIRAAANHARDAQAQIASGRTYAQAEAASDGLVAGQQRWHSTEEDGGPDVGIEVGMPDDSTIWFGEVSTSLWQRCGGDEVSPDGGWWVVHYRKGAEPLVLGRILATWLDESGPDYFASALRRNDSEDTTDGR